MAKLRIDRKSYKRKAYKKKSGVRVKSANVKRAVFLIKDQGAKGRGKQIIKIKKPGSLGGAGFFKKPRLAQEKILRKSVKQFGEMETQGKLSAISVLTKKTNPQVSKEAARLRSWVAEEFD